MLLKQQTYQTGPKNIDLRKEIIMYSNMTSKASKINVETTLSNFTLFIKNYGELFPKIVFSSGDNLKGMVFGFVSGKYSDHIGKTY